MTQRILASTVLSAAAVAIAHGATITSVGVDAATGRDWRTSGTVKPLDVDGDNIYGTDGYMIASFNPASNPNNTLVVPYATYALAGGIVGREGPEASSHQATFDDVTQTGVGPVPDVTAGDWYRGGNSDPNGQQFFTITLTADASFRLGVITDQTPPNPPNLIGESSNGVRVAGGGADSGMIGITGKNAIPDYVLFDITGVQGDVFTIYGRNDPQWSDNALGGFFIDTIPEPSVALLGLLGCLGLTLRRRR